MSDRTAAQQAGLESLRTEYRHAFENWAAQTGRLHDEQNGSGTSVSTVEEQADADAAENDYRGARDRLAAEMLADEDGDR